jgi:pimeloyl-ACP methyl ester carboxylesterase
VIAAAAHLPNLERPEEFNGALADFLDGLDA